MPNKRFKKAVVLVSHTHWDREWYKPFQQYRLKLLKLMDRLLNLLESDPAYKHFLLDGQAIILEDYLEIHPDKSGVIKLLVEKGKLSIGPWYILPDEFLVNGEAIIRNMLYGHEVCENFGGVQKVGYMPDSFGHIAQLPQILRQGGIDSFIYTRGNGDEIDDLGAEYYWRAPDGSEVLAIQQLDGYCNAAGLGSADLLDVYKEKPIDMSVALAQFGKLFKRMENHANSNIFLFNNGCDHFPPQSELGKIVTALRKHYPEVEIIHGSLQDFLKKLRSDLPKLKCFEGELLSGKYHHILSGVWSTRIYLKQMNNRCQNMLSRYTEPGMSILSFICGHNYPSEVINYCWKTLLKNHPHDSICGCSVDEVHREMQPRFAAVLQAGCGLLEEGSNALCTPATREDLPLTLMVFNPLTFDCTEVIDRYCVLPKGTVVKQLKVEDKEGRDIPFNIIETHYAEDFWMVDFSPAQSIEDQSGLLEIFQQAYPKRFHRHQDKNRTRIPIVRLRFVAKNLPACGIRYYLITHQYGRHTSPPCANGVHISGSTIENRYYKVSVRKNGTFDLFDKTCGITYKNLHIIEDTADIGDEYDYAPTRKSKAITSELLSGTVRPIHLPPLKGTLEVAFEMDLPSSVKNDRTQRSKRQIRCPVRMFVSLETDSRLVKIRTEFENRVKDHRLRILFPTGIKSTEVISDGHFYLNHRKVKPAKVHNWVQAPTGTYPQQDFVLVENEKGGFVLFNKGLPEFAPVTGRSGKVTLALTLLRAVEWLSRDDLSSRKGNAGPMIHTPEAQCLGKHTFEYAISTYAGNHIEQAVTALSDQYQTPVFIHQYHGVPKKTGHVQSLLSVGSDHVRVTALKKHEKRDTLICRLYNTTERKRSESVTSDLNISGVWRNDILEKRTKQLVSSACKTFQVKIKPFEIVTIEIVFAVSSTLNDN